MIGSLPFEVHLAVSTVARPHRLEIRLFTDPAAEPLFELEEVDSLEPSIEMVALFAAGVNAQLFHTPASPGPDRLEQLAIEDRGAGHPISVSLEREGVAPPAFGLLSSLLAQCAYHGDPLSRVEITTDSVPGNRDVRQAHESWVGLPRWHDTEFVVDFNDFDPDSFMGIEIEAESPFTDEAAQELKRRLAAWDEIRVLGGFVTDGSPQESMGNLGGVWLDSRWRVVLRTEDVFDGDRASLMLLVNAVRSFHQTVQPIRRINLA